MAYHRYYGVDTHMVRIFNTYGPRLQPTDGRVISNLMIQALLDEDLTVYGDGSQTRSFCYVSDLIAGILLLSRSSEHLPVNIGNPVEWTIKDCAREVLAVTGSTQQDPLRASANRRPHAALPRHHQGQNSARMGAKNRSPPGPGAVPRLLSRQPAHAYLVRIKRCSTICRPFSSPAELASLGRTSFSTGSRSVGTPVVNLDKLTYAGNLQNLASVERHSRLPFRAGRHLRPAVSRSVARSLSTARHPAFCG